VHLPFNLHGSHGAGHGLAHGAGHGTGPPHTGKAGGASPFNFVHFTAFWRGSEEPGFSADPYSSVWFWLRTRDSRRGVGRWGIWSVGRIHHRLQDQVLDGANEETGSAELSQWKECWAISRNPIREGGYWRTDFSQAGTRSTCGCRSEDASQSIKDSRYGNRGQGTSQWYCICRTSWLGTERQGKRQTRKRKTSSNRHTQKPLQSTKIERFGKSLSGRL